MLRIVRFLCLVCCLSASAAQAEPLRIAAASDLKFALDAVSAEFKRSIDDGHIDIVYGSSGKFFAQIQQGAPFDLYFSADISYPAQLAAAGLAAAPVQAYATGRIVLWSARVDASTLNLQALADSRFGRIAIANPRHAPYGQRAEQVLRAVGVWSDVEPRLVFGENIVQTAQFIQSGNADIGIIALSLALSPELSKRGGYVLIPANLHTPMRQGLIITRHGANNAQAKRFADFMASPKAQAIMVKYGFERPDSSHRTPPSRTPP